MVPNSQRGQSNANEMFTTLTTAAAAAGTRTRPKFLDSRASDRLTLWSIFCELYRVLRTQKTFGAQQLCQRGVLRSLKQRALPSLLVVGDGACGERDT